jgi:hypothetical protein
MTMAARTNALVRFGRRVADLVAECNYAQRRSFTLDDYAEFLFRTSSGLRHEPAAAGREHGRPVS